MAKKRKLKKKVKLGLLGLILIIILISFGMKYYKEYKYKQTYEYKLLEKTYTLDDAKVLIENFDDKELDIILNKDHDAKIVALSKEKYFMFKNLDRYLTYIEKNEEISSYTSLVALVNVNRDRDYYDNPNATTITDGKLMIVNKYNALNEDYVPENIGKTSSGYSYANNSLNEETYNAFKDLAEDAKLEGYTILINSSYRDYKDQADLWNGRKTMYGARKADEYAARAGHSEHQTGYAIDVADFYDVNDKFGETEAFTWMIANCYKYGFILRYPKEAENITGYLYEPWHYRYVGKEVAQKIQEEKITFDEYYAFYLEK